MDYYTILLVGGSAVILMCLASIFWFGGLLLPLLYRGAPFVPSSDGRVKIMIEMAHLTDTDHVADLGSGDGKILLAAITAGARAAEGYEIHPGLVWISRLRAKHKKMNDRIHIHQKNFWHADLSNVNVVFLYQFPDKMERLKEKLKRELPKGARVISHAFAFPDWEPEEIQGKVLLYRV